jgi:predicted transposase/invertase (TIGR01784 family)
MENVETGVFMNPRTDFGFKKLFSDKTLLIAFLNDILGEEIVNIQYAPTEQLGSSPEDRRAIFDIFCTTLEGKHIIIEMQVGKQLNFADRVLFYITFPIRNQAPKGKSWNYKLKGVSLIAVLDFVLFPRKKDWAYVMESVYLMRERTKTRFSKKLNCLFIELPKFNKKPEELKTNTDRWLYCLKYLEQLTARPPEMIGETFERLFRLARIEELTPEEMETYSKSILEYSDVRGVAECALLEGRAEGRKEGRKEGREEGRVEGAEKERITFAKRCLQKGKSVEEIAELTELSIERILALAEGRDVT